jgi:quinol-cytochrome oxidoreductase complex cytochrome b subunit
MNRKQKRDAAKKQETRKKDETIKKPEISLVQKILIVFLIIGMIASFIILPIMAAGS